MGPIYQLLQAQLPEGQLHWTIKSNYNPWEEEMGCLDWLDRFDPASVVYVNLIYVFMWLAPHEHD